MSTPQILGVINAFGLVPIAGTTLSWAYADAALTLRVSVQPDGSLATRPISNPVGAYEMLRVTGNACAACPVASGPIYSFALVACDGLPV